MSTIRTLLQGPLTSASIFLYTLCCALIIVLYVLIIVINNRFLVTVPAHGGTLRVGIIGTPQSLDPLAATNPTDRGIVALLHGTDPGDPVGPYKLGRVIQKKRRNPGNTPQEK